jgi:hypothetical protein
MNENVPGLLSGSEPKVGCANAVVVDENKNRRTAAAANPVFPVVNLHISSFIILKFKYVIKSVFSFVTKAIDLGVRKPHR